VKSNPYLWRLSMDPDKIELESINKMFEYEKFSRLIDELDVDELKSFAKSYFKLYLKQQEVIKNFAISGLA
jgi:uncharacterized Fe-S cluster-containing MiaB family protein